MYNGAGGTTEYPWHVLQEVFPTPLATLEAFFQEWLFFGLIIEALDDSEAVKRDSASGSSDISTKAPAIRPQKQLLVSRVHDEYISTADDGQQYIKAEKLMADLDKAWAITLFSLHHSPERIQARYMRMRLCLRNAHYFYTHLPKGFRLDIKFSIGAVAETIAKAMHSVRYWLKLEETCPDQWGDGYYQWQEVRERMLTGGWCESDIDRTVNNFGSLHTMFYMSFLDKTEPSMSHDDCGKLRCQAIACDRQSHWEDKCSCQQVEVDQRRVMSVLNAGSAIPLLHFMEQKRPNLTYQEAEIDSREVSQISINVVASTDSTPYVAISHLQIWSDGLGNPCANSLNACKLRKLRQMVQALPPFVTPTNPAKIADIAAVSPAEDCPLIWLDTLCCPVDPNDKKLALTRMRQVYEKASRVLVLDASLQSYSTTSMEPLEILSRIFTSRWLRRVWTLQEGALAKDLWFQFSDKALSLVQLKASMESIWRDDLRQKIVLFDIRKEIARIEQFFQHSNHDGRGPTLQTLDEALLYRGITDPSDEPLCIGTLMNLPGESLLSPGKDITETLAPGNNLQAEARLSLQCQLRDQRMQVVWKLLAEKFGCLPAQIIFFEEARLEAEGFRWAPQSLLDVQQVYLSPTLRRLRWENQNPGIPTEKGLRVRYPGYRLYLQQYDDGKPRHPWPGRIRIPEDKLVFRDAQTQEWYKIITKKLASDKPESVADLSEFPLHDFVHQYGNIRTSSHQGTKLESAFLLLDETDCLTHRIRKRLQSKDCLCIRKE
ncbi:hypothetical protein LTR97_004225 [Elasticomyces elasticus]|uniref:Heterokaryon incompatibility domain-containing protein n=1 Tax=Elasticomyces elasticus TaxID=574655 RepID=A0AAN7WNI4_9PEZI|nr:hypothetical protein LTR97_004225 [Elasticomyces elasticus]